MQIFEKIKYKKEREINFCGMTVCHYGKAEREFYNESYFELFPKSYFEQVMDTIFEKLDKKYDIVFLCRVNAIGESYLLNYMFDEIIKQNKANSYCFITFNQENYAAMFKLFSDSKVIDIKIDRILLNLALNKRKFKYKNTVFYVQQCTLDEINHLFLQKYAKEDYQVPYPEQIKLWAGIDKFQYLPIKLTEDDILSVEKLKNIDLDNFVFLSPNAKSVLPISDNFWNKLRKELKNKGFSIVENSWEFSFSEATYIASRAKHIIALRSGITELFSTLDTPKHIIYTNHRFSPLTIEKTKEVHSLKNYPFVDPETIYEYEYNDNEEDLIKQIIERL